MTMPFDDVQIITVNVPGDRGPAGPQGAAGPSNVLTIGTVATGAAGSSAVATISGVSPTQTLNLTIPQGIQGAVGPANTLTIGTVTTVASTTGGSATITGTAPNQTLNLVIPRGYGVIPAGATGDVLVKNSATDYDTKWSTPTSAATASALVLRDANGRAQVADPSVNADIATKNYVDNTAGTSANTASTLIRRDASKAIAVSTITGLTTPATTDSATPKTYVDTGDTNTLNSARRISTNTVATTSYTFALTDEGKVVQYTTDNSAVTYTIPTNATVAFPVGSFIDVYAGGSGANTITGAAGVTVRGPDGTSSVTLRNIYSKCRLTKSATDTWQVQGDVVNLVSTGVSTAQSSATSSGGMIIKRDVNGRAQVQDPSVAADIATKNYVDTKLTSRTGTSTIDDSTGTVTDTVLTLKAPASFTGAFEKLNAGGVDYLWTVLSTGNSEPTFYNPRTGTTNQAIQLGNVNGALRVLPYNDSNLYIQSTLPGLQFTGLNGADGTGPVTFGYASAVFHGPIQSGGKVTNVTDPTVAQDAATKNYVDNQDLASRRPAVNAQVGTTYTLALTDERKIVTMNNAAANTLTVPPNSSVAFPVGTVLQVQQIGAGVTTIAPGASVTLQAPMGLAMRQYQTIELQKTGTDTWDVMSYGNVSSSGGVNNIVQITQANYTALGTKDSTTLYVIVG